MTMPFTLAHPAIIVPLARANPKFWVLSALVVGSMAPDFEYFLFLRPVRTIGHDLIGIPLLCIPSGLAVLWAFHCVMKRSLVLLLPGPLRRRLLGACGPFPFRPAGRFLAIVASLAVGAFSHIAWDSFTHENGWVVLRFPPLAAPVVAGVRVFKILQHGSTILGLALLMVWSWRWLRSRAREPDGPGLPDGLRYVVGVALVTVSCGAGAAACLLTSGSGLHRSLVAFVIAALSAAWVAALAYSVGFRAWERRSRATA